MSELTLISNLYLCLGEIWLEEFHKRRSNLDKNGTCNFCWKIGHFERTCRAKRNSRGCSLVGVIQGQVSHKRFQPEETECEKSQPESSVGWVNTATEKRNRRPWDSDKPEVMAVRTKNQTELWVAEAKIPITISGWNSSVLIDSGSPISIFTINELRNSLGAAEIKLQEVEPKDQEFRDYENNPINLLGRWK